MGKAKAGKRNSAAGASPYAKSSQKTNNVFKFNVRARGLAPRPKC